MLWRFLFVLTAGLLAAVRPPGQSTLPKPPAASASQSQRAPDEQAKKGPDPEAELQRAIADAGNDRAALVRKLTDYLARFPDAPRKAAVYRALVEACQQLQDPACSLDNAERLIAIHPDDTEMMLIAVALLEKKGDDPSLVRATGYLGRVLDRVEKSSAQEKPARLSPAEWQNQRDGLRVALYLLRGKVEKEQRNFDAAEKDLAISYRIRSSALAAEQLGEIAELRKDPRHAIEYYLNAFVLPESGPGGTVDRREVRQKLGNVWRLVHGSENGLGDAVLAAYDHTETPYKETPPAAKNQGAKDLFAFVLRRLDGSSLPLAPFQGKSVVLSFWATWCGPCRELEPRFVKVAASYAGNPNVIFYAVNTDEDESRVKPFLEREKWNVPVVFSDGLDDFLGVNSLPTVIVVDRAGKIGYRANGLDEERFVKDLTAAIEQALGRPAS